MKKTDQIVGLLSEQIVDGTLPPLRRLPSMRKAAKDYQVSKNTVVEAHDRLSARIKRPAQAHD